MWYMGSNRLNLHITFFIFIWIRISSGLPNSRVSYTPFFFLLQMYDALHDDCNIKDNLRDGEGEPTI